MSEPITYETRDGRIVTIDPRKCGPCSLCDRKCETWAEAHESEGGGDE